MIHKPSSSIKSNKSKQRGASIAEAAIVFPLWIILLAVFGELYSYLNSYMQLQQLVREGLTMAATQSNMTPAAVSQQQDALAFHSCVNSNNPPLPPTCGATILHTKIARLASTYNLRIDGDPFTSIKIDSQLVGREINLQLEYNYRPLMGRFMGVTIRAAGTGSYLCGGTAVPC